MDHFKMKLERTSIEHRRPSINVRSLLPSANCVIKETISQSANSESFSAKMRDTPTCFPILTILYLVASCLYFHVKWRNARHFDWRLSIRLFWNGIGEAHADPEWPESLKNTTNVYSIHLQLWMALPCQTNARKWKYVNPCQDFLGIPDQSTAYVKRASATRMDVRT